MTAPVPSLPISQITVGQRHRRDLGDIDGLAASIAEVGLLQPIAVTFDGHLIAGGDWLRGQTEHCIMCIRGKPVVTLTNQTTVLHAPVRGHSVKPVEFYDFVESLCPAPRYADLFSRYRHNDKWDCHGDEAPAAACLRRATP
jgi:N6-adenosine-specific RNA methylase IME4